jgi:heavy metal translocating P-type ATPase
MMDTKIDRWLAAGSAVAIAAHLLFGLPQPLWVVLGIGGTFLVGRLAIQVSRGSMGADLLAGVSIVASVGMGEPLVGAIIVLMLSGGTALESYAVGQASQVLSALARRMPRVAHRQTPEGFTDVAADEIAPGERIVVLPHEVCPVDGEVEEGHGSMDESFLTGEPFRIAKAPGSGVISGAVNGEEVLTVRATRPSRDSRYAQILRVIEESEDRKPRMRRMGERLGAWYGPAALALAGAAWAVSSDPSRFLGVLVVATPCPLLLAIPIAVVGAISSAAKRGIVIKNPALLEEIGRCRTFLFDKTGTLTYGTPELTQIETLGAWEASKVLTLAGSLERYSKHPLAGAIVRHAEERGLPLGFVSHVAEIPGQGLVGDVGGRSVQVTGRQHWNGMPLPEAEAGLECLVVVDGEAAALFRFRDRPRKDSRTFIEHLGPKHRSSKVMIVSGDRESEVLYLARQVGIEQVYAGQSPEDKVRIVSAETALAPTLFVGDGINDAPAMRAATVSVAFGRGDVVSEAADAVIFDASLKRVDELIHIGDRMRRIALQSALGGMALSGAGMLMAAGGWLPPVAGAVAQELIDLVAVLNAVRVAFPPRDLVDF